LQNREELRSATSPLAHFANDEVLKVKVPGLMTGMAGIGYQLLRLAQPDGIPSILLYCLRHLGKFCCKKFVGVATYKLNHRLEERIYNTLKLINEMPIPKANPTNT
jgi:hypothetical protein